MKQNSAVISKFCTEFSCEKQNSKQNFHFETRVGVDHDVSTKQNSACDIRILTKFCWEKQNSKQNFDYETRIGVDNET